MLSPCAVNQFLGLEKQQEGSKSPPKHSFLRKKKSISEGPEPLKRKQKRNLVEEDSSSI